MKVLKVLFLLLLIFSPLCLRSKNFAYADSVYPNESQVYYIVDENNEIISQSSYVEIGDIIITKELKKFEIYDIDQNERIAYAEYKGYYQKPKVSVKKDDLNLSTNGKKSVGLYLTHNDESYVPTDGYSSIYGEGGVHDVANYLSTCFKDLGYDVYLDETLHLPHDSGAYTRSNKTATSLLQNDIDALFDIHRDGVSRSVYVKTVDGVERCKVRIVVGQANPNMEDNLQFAMYLTTVAEEICPWLFLDIYYAKGHYNQALTSKGLLFEMGTYLAEKKLVLETVPYLAKVVDKTLFNTVIKDEDIEITDSPTQDEEENLVNNVLENKNNQNSKVDYTNVIIFATLFIAGMIGIFVYTYTKNKNKKLNESSVKKSKR